MLAESLRRSLAKHKQGSSPTELRVWDAELVRARYFHSVVRIQQSWPTWAALSLLTERGAPADTLVRHVQACALHRQTSSDKPDGGGPAYGELQGRRAGEQPSAFATQVAAEDARAGS
jgi:hypothetical protein